MYTDFSSEVQKNKDFWEIRAKQLVAQMEKREEQISLRTQQTNLADGAKYNYYVQTV